MADLGDMEGESDRSGDPGTSPPLCQSCSSIDLDGIFSDDIFRVSPKRSHSVWKPSYAVAKMVGFGADCALCRFFKQCFLQANCLRLWVHVSRTGNVFPVESRSWPYTDTPCLTLDFPDYLQSVSSCILDANLQAPERFPGDGPAHLRPVSIEPSSVDFDTLRSWLRECAMTHGKPCGREEEAPFVPDLRVIDCDSRRIVGLPGGHRYVTLSYLWGAAVPGDSSPETTGVDALPQRVPKVIDDAVVATRNLGFQYLWVDRYCLPRGSHGKMTEQLRNMGNIYANSYVTIIAAAGEGPDFGLPGVTTTARAQQPSIRIGKHHLVYCCTTRDQILHSRWNSRGWTYQEALLSRRRLVFCTSQVHFECRAMHRLESIHIDVNGREPRNGIQYFSRGRAFATPGQEGDSHRELGDRIIEYTRRHLTYDEDGLNAFLGILNVYAKLDDHIHHFCGVPLYPAKRIGQAPSSLDSLIYGLCWTLTGFPVERRRACPSWSWTGWKWCGDISKFEGRVNFRHIAADEDDIFQPMSPYDMSISVKFHDGSVWDWKSSWPVEENLREIQTLGSSSLDDVPACLLISCFTCQATISRRNPRISSAEANFMSTANSYHIPIQSGTINLSSTILAGKSSVDLKALVLGFRFDGAHGKSDHVDRERDTDGGAMVLLLLLVQPVSREGEELSFERVECVKVYDYNHGLSVSGGYAGFMSREHWYSDALGFARETIRLC